MQNKTRATKHRTFLNPLLIFHFDYFITLSKTPNLDLRRHLKLIFLRFSIPYTKGTASKPASIRVVCLNEVTRSVTETNILSDLHLTRDSSPNSPACYSFICFYFLQYILIKFISKIPVLC